MLLFYLEIGFLPFNTWVFFDGDQKHFSIEDQYSYYTEMNAEVVAFDMVFVGGTVRTDMRPITVDNWSPFWMTYGFNAGFRFGLVEAGFRHSCLHPITAYSGLLGERTPIAEGGYREIYLRIGNQ